MAKKVISVSHQMKGILDDDYTLYDDGSVLHFYDKHTYPGGQKNLPLIICQQKLSRVYTMLQVPTIKN